MSNTTRRRGISLLEVMISIGILSVGLMSVVALVPAGATQSARALHQERLANLAVNTAADAATFGLLREACVTSSGSAVYSLDLAGGFPNIPTGSLRSLGIHSGTTTPAAGSAFHTLFLQSRDDLAVIVPEDPDEVPENIWPNIGPREFVGQSSAALLIASGPTQQLSVICFMSAGGTFSAVAATVENGQLVALPDFENATPREYLKPGTVILSATSNPVVHELLAAAAFENLINGDTDAFVTLSTGTSILSGTHAVQILPNSGGVFTRPFHPETTNKFLH